MSDDPFAAFGVASKDEIQRAHDLLHAIVCGDIEAPMRPENFRLVQATHDALSWVLGFDCGETFRNMLTVMMQELKKNGAIVWRSHRPV